MRRQFTRPFVTAIDDRNLMRSFFAKIAERFGGHLSGPDYDHVFVVESLENLPPEIGHGHAWHAYPALMDGRFAGHPPRYVQRRLKRRRT